MLIYVPFAFPEGFQAVTDNDKVRNFTSFGVFMLMLVFDLPLTRE